MVQAQSAIPLDMEPDPSERRDPAQTDDRYIGHVVFCDGSKGIIATLDGHVTSNEDNPWAVGRLITILARSSRIIASITSVEADANRNAAIGEGGATMRTYVSVDLVGEIWDRNGTSFFTRGVSAYPPIGAPAHRTRAEDLAAVFAPSGNSSITVGRLSQDQTIRASVNVDDLLAKHFSVLGTTGVGKSNSVALILHRALSARPNLRVLIMDPHNEYAHSFQGMAEIVNPDDLNMPFWLFKLDEIADVFARARSLPEDELDLLSEMIALAKNRFGMAADARSQIRKDVDASAHNYTPDTPVPYRMSDLLAIIEERIGALDGKNERQALKNLKYRIKSVANDPRYRFMFSQRTVEDTMEEVLGRLFRIPLDGKPVTIVQLAGFPSEVVNALVSVLCRMSFDMGLYSNGRMPILVMCEEAHRYVPADRDLGFLPTRRAIARIAREGRKYGVHLGVITQRPSELDSTVLSQCSTVFTLRLANEADKAIIRNAISDAAASTLATLSALTIGEAIAFGEGIATPMRLRFTLLPPERRPKSNITGTQEHVFGQMDPTALNNIIGRLRAANRAKV
jgi:uncharacterized protein